MNEKSIEYKDKYYTTIEDAIKEIKKRDYSKLKDEIKTFFKKEIGSDTYFDLLDKTNNSMICRQIYGPRVDILYADYISKQAGINLIQLNYQNDNFTAGSYEKYSYVSPKIIDESLNVDELKLVSSNKKIKKMSNKKRLCDIMIDKKTLPEYHRDWINNICNIPNYDMSDLFNGKKANEYYPALLSLFLNNVLIEDFHYDKNDPNLTRFTENVFEPAYERVCNVFGVNPLIKSIPTKEYFDYYVKDKNTLDKLKQKKFKI
jgi:hypothetical protein